LLSATMEKSFEAFIASVLVDLVTIGLVCTLWIVGYGMTITLYRANNAFFPIFPRLVFFGVTIVSIISIFITNFLILLLDRLWLRAFFFFLDCIYIYFWKHTSLGFNVSLI